MAEPSAWLLGHLPELERAAALGPVADLACGRGRNARALAQAGLPVIGVDRSAEHLAELGDAVPRVRADLETPHGIPFRPGSCGAIHVFRFLYRPLAAAIVETLAPGGALLYETFTTRQRELGWGPRSPAFLLGEGELPELFRELEVAESWEGATDGARPEAVARLLAVKG